MESSSKKNGNSIWNHALLKDDVNHGLLPHLVWRWWFDYMYTQRLVPLDLVKPCIA